MTTHYRRGDVVMAPFGKEEYLPFVILSESLYNQRSGTIIGVPLFQGQSKPGFPIGISLSKKVQGHDSYAKPGQIKTLSTLSLGYIVDQLDAPDITTILAGLSEILQDPLLQK